MKRCIHYNSNHMRNDEEYFDYRQSAAYYEQTARNLNNHEKYIICINRVYVKLIGKRAIHF